MVSRDPVLLETRTQILKSVGFSVVTMLSLNEALAQFAEKDFDIVILCHSIPVTDRERLAAQMRKQCSHTPIIFISSLLNDYDPFADAIVESDPDQFIAGLREILKRNQESFEGGRAA
jgi:DNA-binding response OmpR family regulator